DPKNVIAVGAGQTQWSARLKRSHSRHCPAAEQVVDDSMELLRAGQFIEIAEHQTVLAIEFAATIVGASIVLVSVDGRCPASSSVPPRCAVSMGESISSQKLQPLREPLSEARIQPVIPGRSRRINIVETRRSKTEKRHTLRDVGDSVGRLPANRIRCA